MAELVLISGYQASGKTTITQEYLDKGFKRVNRDELGGSVESTIPVARNHLSAGESVVADNTFLSIPDRTPWIEMAKEVGASIHCIHMDTAWEDCQMNACLRMIERRGKVLSPEEFKGESDPNLFPIAVLFMSKNKFENKKKKGVCPIPDFPGSQVPKKSHGFDSVELRKFKRVWGDEHTHSAFIFDADGLLRESTGEHPWPTNPDHVEVKDKELAVIKQMIADQKPDFLLGVSNQSTHEKKECLTPLADIDACFERTNELTGLDIEWTYCPHYRFPTACYCRKPQVGLAAELIVKHNLLPSKCTMFGDSTSDGTFAKRAGFNFVHVKELK